MARVITVTGVTKVLKNMAVANASMAKGVEFGLKRAGLFIIRKSKQVVPVKTSKLKNSGDAKESPDSKGGFQTDVQVYYDTDYAIFVHEMVGNRHKPGKQAKYLEGPIRANLQNIHNIVSSSVFGTFKASHFNK
jgi:hypothetical protein